MPLIKIKRIGEMYVLWRYGNAATLISLKETDGRRSLLKEQEIFRRKHKEGMDEYSHSGCRRLLSGDISDRILKYPEKSRVNIRFRLSDIEFPHISAAVSEHGYTLRGLSYMFLSGCSYGYPRWISINIPFQWSYPYRSCRRFGRLWNKCRYRKTVGGTLLQVWLSALHF